LKQIFLKSDGMSINTNDTDTTPSERDFLRTSKTIDYEYGEEDFEETLLVNKVQNSLDSNDEGCFALL
jgi:hypothetical protein